MYNLLNKYKEFYIIFFLLLFNLSINNILGYNEMTLMPFAKQFFNPNWIPNDFALESPTNYQLLFNYIIGWICSFLPFHIVSIIGRLLLFLFFAFSLFRFNKILKINSVLFLVLVYFFINNQYILAGEWVVKGLEFKTLSYSFVLLGLSLYLERKTYLSYIFFGLAVSFHVLIGLYSFIAFSIAILCLNGFNKFLNIQYFISIILFSIFGSFGWFSILTFLLFESQQMSYEISKYYVEFRISHHVNPNNWKLSSILMFVFNFIVILFCFTKLELNKKTKFLYVFYFANLLFFLVGLFFYFTKDFDKLKYYWFRTSDAFTSFFFFISIGLFINYIIEYYQDRILKVIKNFSLKLNILPLLVLLIISLNNFFLDLKKIYDANKLEFVGQFPLSNDVFIWINKNTPKSSGIITSPIEDYFYVLAQRRSFVNYKTGPADVNKILEWYERLKILNNNQDINFNSSIYIQWEELENNYNKIDENTWREIGIKYNFQYLLCKSWVIKDFEIAYKNEAFVLYIL